MDYRRPLLASSPSCSATWTLLVMAFTLDVHADLRISLVQLGRPRGLRRWLLGAHACKVEDLVWCTSPLLRRLSAALPCGLGCCDEYKVVGEVAMDKIKILRALLCRHPGFRSQGEATGGMKNGHAFIFNTSKVCLGSFNLKNDNTWNDQL
uniref:Uncharacterized protein n=1 Tax=Triticum urartu TaxID=4572 RepID=A0A8R7RDA2_TRIUA